jgi:hypothetical protein
MLRLSVTSTALALAVASIAASANCRAETESSPEAPAPAPAHPADKDRVVAAEQASPTSYHGKPFTLDGTIGWESADLTTFQSSLGARSFTANVIPAQLSGPAAQIGFGVRFYSLTLGIRGGVAWLGGDKLQDPAKLYSADAEVGLKIPFDRLELSLLFAGGYSVIGGLSDLVNGLGAGLDVDGANARFSVGLDYFFSNSFSVGARAAAEVLFLARRGVALRDVPNQVTSIDNAESGLLSGSGSSVGAAVNLSAGPAFHF